MISKLLFKPFFRRAIPGLSALCCTFYVVSTATPVAAAPAKKAKVAAKTATLKAKPGYILGRVTNAAGKPLAGAEVNIYGTTMAGANTTFSVQTNGAGVFSQRVPEGIYGASAYYKTKFNGKNYNFTLRPQDGSTAKKHDSAKGVVKNFRWQISGLKPGERPGAEGAHTEGTKYYGGYVYVKSKEEGFGGDRVYFPKGSTLVITMTPRAKLIDGSTGKAKTFRRAFDENVTNSVSWHLTDIPVGLYQLNAVLLSPDGVRRSLNVKHSLGFSDPFTPSINVDFEPTSFEDMQMMQITVEP